MAEDPLNVEQVEMVGAALVGGGVEDPGCGPSEVVRRDVAETGSLGSAANDAEKSLRVVIAWCQARVRLRPPAWGQMRGEAGFGSS